MIGIDNYDSTCIVGGISLVCFAFKGSNIKEPAAAFAGSQESADNIDRIRIIAALPKSNGSVYSAGIDSLISKAWA